MLHCAGRHPRIEGITRILNDCDPSSLLDGNESCRPIIERAAQDDADDARSVRECRAPKERIDGGTMTILARTMNAAKRPIALDHEMLVGRGDVDRSVAKRLSVFHLLCRKRLLARENMREKTLRVGRNVNDDENRRRERVRKSLDDLNERVDAAGGSSNDDNALI